MCFSHSESYVLLLEISAESKPWVVVLSGCWFHQLGVVQSPLLSHPCYVSELGAVCPQLLLLSVEWGIYHFLLSVLLAC